MATPRPTAEFEPALVRYQTIQAAGGWPTLPEGPTLHPGDVSAAVPVLRTRLTVTGDLVEVRPPEAAIEFYDDALVRGVRAFQVRHGLIDDGVVGKHTRVALNHPVDARIRQLELNRDRLAGRAPSLENRYVRVNIPGYRLELVDHGEPILEMPVVVGRRDRPTPEFSSAITFLVVNPTWTIPTTLAYEDFLPKVRRDPNYLRDHDIQVFGSWRPGAAEIDPDWIDWRRIGPRIKRLKLRQRPGPANPLGRFKFHMPNEFEVYLHDTPSRELLRHDQRTFSSGCIRVGDARALVDALLERQPHWSPERLDETLASERTTQINLVHPVRIHVGYQTAWVTADGTVHFREDVYGQEPGWAPMLMAEPDLAPVPAPTQGTAGTVPDGEMSRADR